MTTSQLEHVETLQQRLEKATRRAESLRRVIESIGGELELGPLLTRLIESAVELLGADDGTVGLVIQKADGPVIRSVASYNMPDLELGHEFGPGVGLSGRVLQERRPIRLDSYTPTALPSPDHFAAIGIPIWSRRSQLPICRLTRARRPSCGPACLQARAPRWL